MTGNELIALEGRVSDVIARSNAAHQKMLCHDYFRRFPALAAAATIAHDEMRPMLRDIVKELRRAIQGESAAKAELARVMHPAMRRAIEREEAEDEAYHIHDDIMRGDQWGEYGP